MSRKPAHLVFDSPGEIRSGQPRSSGRVRPNSPSTVSRLRLFEAVRSSPLTTAPYSGPTEPYSESERSPGWRRLPRSNRPPQDCRAGAPEASWHSSATWLRPGDSRSPSAPVDGSWGRRTFALSRRVHPNGRSPSRLLSPATSSLIGLEGPDLGHGVKESAEIGGEVASEPPATSPVSVNPEHTLSSPAVFECHPPCREWTRGR